MKNDLHTMKFPYRAFLRSTVMWHRPFMLSLLFVSGLLLSTPPRSLAQSDTVRFAVIGDYGKAGTPEQDVANLVKGWNPDFIITVGDNNYSSGEASTIDRNIGQYYHDFIFPYTGGYGAGATINRFFPSLGNHDWGNKFPNPGAAQPYLDYFALPGNERYYDFVRGPVHLFALDTDPNEPDGRTSGSAQAAWLSNKLAGSTSPWKIVYFHHAPYSSGKHGSDPEMQWPFQEWGATAVVAGHDHTYERLLIDGFPYFVNGVGGAAFYAFGTIVPGSQVRYNSNYGAMLVEASPEYISFKFVTRAGTVVDTYVINTTPVAPASLTLNPPAVTGGKTSLAQVALEGAAPAGGASITLASANPAAAKVPATVTVPEGSTTASFTVTTYPVSADFAVDISATSGGVTKAATLSVKPPSLSALTLSPSSLPGSCVTSKGTVTLSGKAPAGGSVISLSNGNPAAVVPASVTIPAGSTSTTFSITTSAVPSSKSGAVTASYRGVSNAKTLTVRPVGVAAVSLAPNPVVGPNDVEGTVRLECAAAPGDVLVTLSSTNTSTAFPAAGSITIPAGQINGSFAVTTRVVSATSTVTINAAANNISKGTLLTVNRAGGGSAFNVKVNFQTPSAAVPSGYLADAGRAFADRGNGFSYGWSADISSGNTRDRNAANSPDQRYDTLIYTQRNGSHIWEIAVPNGTYVVRLVAGDPSYFSSQTYRFAVEGVLVVDGKPSSASRWLEGTRSVPVSDGRLTISNATGAVENEICFVEISSP